MASRKDKPRYFWISIQFVSPIRGLAKTSLYTSGHWVNVKDIKKKLGKKTKRIRLATVADIPIRESKFFSPFGLLKIITLLDFSQKAKW